MSSKFLGLPFDIHGGGMDLQFPHHENEVAQTEAATGKQFSHFWMHVGLLTINGEKMSKSIGNIINVKDLLKTWDAEILRMFFAQAHYRSPPDFSEKALADIEKGRERLYRFRERLEEYSKQASQQKPSLTLLTEVEKEYLNTITELQKEFEYAMDDDFNTPKAFASLFEFVNKSNKFFEQQLQPNPELCKHALDVYLAIGSVLTLFQSKTNARIEKEPDVINKLQILLQSYGKTVQIPTVEELMKALLFARDDARKHKDWKTADRIRNDLEELGFEIQDTTKGPVWRRK
jgi:cysteinyl-tRNA synthetase